MHCVAWPVVVPRQHEREALHTLGCRTLENVGVDLMQINGTSVMANQTNV